MRRVAYRLGVDVIPRERFDIVRRDFYSPIPHVAGVSEELWSRRDPLGGIDLDVEGAIRFLEAELGPYIEELDVPLTGPQPPGTFFVRNNSYGPVDAEILYAMIRAKRPRRMVELGSGYTTVLATAACRRNAIDRAPVESYVAYDPYPRPEILGRVEPPAHIIEMSALDVPMDTFRELEADDILFVDTTHTVKLGSEVNRLILEVLPVLAPGVVVHFHDIFLPWEYPREWLEQQGYFWAEQYLLQAFLAFNACYRVALPVHALWREHPERLAALIPSFTGEGIGPGAMWIVRR